MYVYIYIYVTYKCAVRLVTQVKNMHCTQMNLICSVVLQSFSFRPPKFDSYPGESALNRLTKPIVPRRWSAGGGRCWEGQLRGDRRDISPVGVLMDVIKEIFWPTKNWDVTLKNIWVCPKLRHTAKFEWFNHQIPSTIALFLGPNSGDVDSWSPHLAGLP